MHTPNQPKESLGTVLAQRLREALKLRQMTQAELAQRVGLSRTMVWHLANARSPKPSIRAVYDMACELRVSVDYLLGITPTPEPYAVPLCSEAGCSRRSTHECCLCLRSFCPPHLRRSGRYPMCHVCAAGAPRP